MVKLSQIGTTKQFEATLIESGKYPNTAKIKLGGSDINKFVPNINISKWNDECWLNFNLDNFAVISQQHNFLNDQVSITVGLVTFFSYVLPGSDNVLEFGIKLSAKPPVNRISFTISQSPDLIWYKQPALTVEDIARGDIQPDNAIGSYAIYSSTKKNGQYRTGKFGNLYCFEAVDSLGAKRTIEPILSGNKLTLTIPQSFLNTATYPITIMGMGDTFGNTTLGTGGSTPIASVIYGGNYTGIAGTLTEIHLGILESSTPNVHIFKGGLYLHSDSSFVSGSETNTRQDIGTTAAWYTFTVPATQPTLSAVDYVIVGWASATGAGSPYIKWDTTGPGHYVAATWGDDFPTPVSFTHADRKYSVHAEVTTGGETHAITSISAGSHAHNISSATLWQRSNLDFASCQHGHSADLLSLSQRTEISSISDATHSHTVESLEVIQRQQFIISDTSHAHTADSPTLLQKNELSISGSVHFHTAEDMQLAQLQQIEIISNSHTHIIEEIMIVAVAEIVGSTCWGHVTGVLEDNVRTFATNWAGTGAVDNSGDAERLILVSGEYMESELINTGTAYIELLQNHYAASSDGTLKYRHGATQGDCTSASWSDYIVPFDSLGYVQIRIEV